MKLLKFVFFCGLLISSSGYAAEVWKWNTQIGHIQTFGGGNSAYACFTTNAVDRNICFNLTEIGSKEKYSMLLSARAAKLPVSFSYVDNQSITSLWFDNYLAWHIWLEE